MSDTFDFTYEGVRFRAYVEHDTDAEPPWEGEEGHGPIRDARAFYGLKHQGIKRPGERVLHRDRGTVWLYDIKAAVEIAKRDGWGYSPPHENDRANCYRTKGEIAALAVEEDFKRMRAWMRDDWWYVGVCVVSLDRDGDPEQDRYQHALWRIESDSPDYHREVAEQLAAEIIHEKRKHFREELHEARERRYWHSRDVVTRPLATITIEVR